MKIAVISDVHGNFWALEAVLKDIKARGVDRVLNLGDCVYGPLAPLETALLLRDGLILSIKGNRDRAVVEKGKRAAEDLTAAFVRSRLDEASLRWLRYLRSTDVYASNVFLCHGCLDSDEIHLFERVSALGVSLRADFELLRHVLLVKQNLILCGHSHIFRAAVLPDGTTVVNPGSVGLPAYRSTRPFPYIMAAGSPFARYAAIESRGSGYRVESVEVRYDWDAAAAAALANGRPDWAVWLRTGRA